tara:strand:+ start:50 stop:256 length:207 start_codon:yes stop_codon:yes gene_type:complete
MVTRHKMLGVTYDWENEKAVLTYSFNFNNYSKLEKLDSLSDVINLLQQKYDDVLEKESFKEKHYDRVL